MFNIQKYLKGVRIENPNSLRGLLFANNSAVLNNSIVFPYIDEVDLACSALATGDLAAVKIFSTALASIGLAVADMATLSVAIALMVTLSSIIYDIEKDIGNISNKDTVLPSITYEAISI